MEIEGEVEDSEEAEVEAEEEDLEVEEDTIKAHKIQALLYVKILIINWIIQ